MINYHRSDDIEEFLIYRELDGLDYEQLVDVIKPALSASVFGLLGNGFIDYFFKSVAHRGDSCIVGAFDGRDNLLGVAIAVMDHRDTYSSIMRKNWLCLAWKANFYLLRPAVLIWIIRGLFKSSDQNSCRGMENIDPRLLVISVGSGCEKQGIGSRLIDKVDEWFRSLNIPSYLIFTEKKNVGANRLYEKKECEKLCIRNNRSKQIVVWVRHTDNTI